MGPTSDLRHPCIHDIYRRTIGARMRHCALPIVCICQYIGVLKPRYFVCVMSMISQCVVSRASTRVFSIILVALQLWHVWLATRYRILLYINVHPTLNTHAHIPKGNIRLTRRCREVRSEMHREINQPRHFPKSLHEDVVCGLLLSVLKYCKV